jgi:imidazolonepropionase-like amidohydrolase
MKLVKCATLFDGSNEIEDCYVEFEDDEIKYVGRCGKSEMNEANGNEVIAEDSNYNITPGFIDAHSHIGLVRSGELIRKKRQMSDSTLFILW